MEASLDKNAYGKLRAFVESLGGSMNYKPGGGPGGVWQIELHGRTAEVAVRDSGLNLLDLLYVAKTSNPRSWDDFEKNPPLVDNAFWKLVNLIEFQRS